MILFEKEVLGYLNIPSIPKKEFDGSTPFAKGVAVVGLSGEREAYAVASFDPEGDDKAPRIIKTFGLEPFRNIKKVFVVPNYMSSVDDVENMDLDEQAKKKAAEILKEASEIESEGTKEEKPMENLPEWIFSEIHSKQEAEAWLRNFQSRNKQKGRIPTTEENIKLRLFSIYSELQKKQK